MSTVFNVRNLRLGNVSRAALAVGAFVVVVAIVLAYFGWQTIRGLTTTKVYAYFPEALALYAGDTVQIMGVQVGNVDKVEPAGNRMRVTFHYDDKYKVPVNATASIINPTLVAARNIQLSWPPEDARGPFLKDDMEIHNTQVPVEWDQLRDQIDRILRGLGPCEKNPTEPGIEPCAPGQPDDPKGPFGDLIQSAAYNFAGKGKQINETLNALSEAVTTLNQGRGDFFAVVRSLALFVNALYQSDQRFVALNRDLASFTGKFTHTDTELADTLQNLDSLLTTTRKFVGDNGKVLAKDIDNLAEVTNAILQPEPKDGLETGLHVFPNLAANIVNISAPNQGGIIGLPVISNMANPLQFICSAIQAGSRLGYQESAEMCAQYLAPILDAIKFNYLPFGLNIANPGETLPKQIAYSESRLQPPPGYKDTTVPGVFSRDTLWSFGNHEPGWIVAPGMQGVDVQPFTENMLTPDSLAELMGGPDISPPPAPPAFGVPPGGHLPGPPDAYSENNPLPPPWYVQPAPPPGPAPGVTAGQPLPAPPAPGAPPPPGGYPAEGAGQ